MASIRYRNGKHDVKVYAGVDPYTGKERYRGKTFDGGNSPKEQARIRKLAMEFELEVRNERAAASRTRRGTDTAPCLPELMRQRAELVGLDVTTQRSVQEHIARVARSEWGAIPVDRLTPLHVTQLYAWLSKKGSIKGGPLAPSTAARTCSEVRAALNWARKVKLVAESPANDVPLPVVPAKTKALPPVEVVRERIREYGDEHPDDLVMFKIESVLGLRRGELTGLRWADINSHDMILTLSETVVAGPNGRAHTKTTKTNRQRVFQLPPGLVKDIFEMKDRLDYELAQVNLPALREDSYLFSSATDHSRPLSPSTVDKKWARCRGTDPLMAKLTLHEVRHIVGSIVVTRFGLAAGSRMLGHASQTTTAKVYSHLINQADTAAMAALYDEF